MLKLHNVRMELSNVRKKNKETTKCEKRTITCDVGTAQYEKKVREPPNVRKKLSHMMLEQHNARMELSNVRKK